MANVRFRVFANDTHPCPRCGERTVEVERLVATGEAVVQCDACGHTGRVACDEGEALRLWNLESPAPVSQTGLIRIHTPEGQGYDVCACHYCKRDHRLELHWEGQMYQVRCHNCGARGPMALTRAGSVDSWNGFRTLPREPGPQRRIRFRRYPLQHNGALDLKTLLKSISDGRSMVAVEVRRDDSPLVRILAELKWIGREVAANIDVYEINIGLDRQPVEHKCDRSGTYSGHLIVDENRGSVYTFKSQAIAVDLAAIPRPTFNIPSQELVVRI